jgi:hypothetical protein
MFWTFEHLNFGFVSNFDILGFLIGFIILISHFSIDMTLACPFFIQMIGLMAFYTQAAKICLPLASIFSHAPAWPFSFRKS